ncbi:hypothetical protein HN512_02835 [Candidatus Peregrinibacteria bacterium]|jgi:hypothetical protein|nr:hypothetical protein [Candidatus Peregrinibacteria bacterium]MBT3598748.1 hypothetical protein [Candidatus Peregrinibacteria bacterium]MBT4586026.1 hypothetical protein [Candidatus Peregrinibacteria bacterium]MBT6731242.1 hypothetical protein [Candidatus Peregrinibacteria bacterium]MBT7008820.1 hypothetical protein [Candidatus Peregrinibacteria bacterium]
MFDTNQKPVEESVITIDPDNVDEDILIAFCNEDLNPKDTKLVAFTISKFPKWREDAERIMYEELESSGEIVVTDIEAEIDERLEEVLNM